MPILKVLRTPKNGALGADHFPGHGTVLRPVEDPEGVSLNADMLKAIRLEPDFPKLPARLANRISDLYVKMLNRASEEGVTLYASGGQKEVSVVLLRDDATMKEWRVLVPTQVVGGASVEADYDLPLCDIETGEEVKNFPPDGWSVAGTSHSHNTMGAFFSSVDDRNELPQPGVHFVCGSFTKVKEDYDFRVAMSIVYHGMRYEKVIQEDQSIRSLSWDDIVEFTREEFRCHDNVLEYVKLETPTTWDHAGFGRGLAKQYEYDPILSYYNGLDDRRSQYAAHYPPRTEYAATNVDRQYVGMAKRSFISMPPIADLTKSDELCAWITQFDKACGSLGMGLAHKGFDAADNPTEILGNRGVCAIVQPGVAQYERDTLPCVPDSGFWVPAQTYLGSKRLEITLAFFVKESDGGLWPYVKVAGSMRWTRMIPCFTGQLTKLAKKQRRDTKKSAIPTRFEIDSPDEGFTTRGLKASDFTPVEIGLLIEAWANDDRTLEPMLEAFDRFVGFDID